MSDSDSIRRGTLLDELDARQNELLDELEALNVRVEQLLREWAPSAAADALAPAA